MSIYKFQRRSFSCFVTRDVLPQALCGEVSRAAERCKVSLSCLRFLISGVNTLHQVPSGSAQFQICLLAFDLRLLQFALSHAPVPYREVQDGGHEVAKGWRTSSGAVNGFDAVQSDATGFN